MHEGQANPTQRCTYSVHYIDYNTTATPLICMALAYFWITDFIFLTWVAPVMNKFTLWRTADVCSLRVNELNSGLFLCPMFKSRFYLQNQHMRGKMQGYKKLTFQVIDQLVENLGI